MSGRRAAEDGQSTVELALALPVVVFLALLLLQVGLLVRDQSLVSHAAREAVRQAAVDPDPAAAIERAGSGTSLRRDRLLVTVGPRGGPGSRVEVRVRYDAPTEVALVGGLIGSVRLEATATMRVEG